MFHKFNHLFTISRKTSRKMEHVVQFKGKTEAEIKKKLPLLPQSSSVKTSCKHSRQSFQMSKFVDHKKRESLEEEQAN